jgi:hypothetical protein
MARDYGLRGGRGELGTCKWRKSQTATKIVVSEDIAAGVETTVDHPAIEEGHTHGRELCPTSPTAGRRPSHEETAAILPTHHQALTLRRGPRRIVSRFGPFLSQKGPCRSLERSECSGTGPSIAGPTQGDSCPQCAGRRWRSGTVRATTLSGAPVTGLVP